MAGPQRRRAKQDQQALAASVDPGEETIAVLTGAVRSEHSRGILHQVPIDSIVADTQGALGYQIQQALQNEFHRRGLKKSVATIVTQTLVDRNDPAFTKPSKPIGQFYTHAEAEDRMSVEKWAMVEDAGRGWRKVVPSPQPKRILDVDVIKRLVARFGSLNQDV